MRAITQSSMHSSLICSWTQGPQVRHGTAQLEHPHLTGDFAESRAALPPATPASAFLAVTCPLMNCVHAPACRPCSCHVLLRTITLQNNHSPAETSQTVGVTIDIFLGTCKAVFCLRHMACRISTAFSNPAPEVPDFISNLLSAVWRMCLCPRSQQPSVSSSHHDRREVCKLCLLGHCMPRAGGAPRGQPPALPLIIELPGGVLAGGVSLLGHEPSAGTDHALLAPAAEQLAASSSCKQDPHVGCTAKPGTHENGNRAGGWHRACVGVFRGMLNRIAFLCSAGAMSHGGEPDQEHAQGGWLHEARNAPAGCMDADWRTPLMKAALRGDARTVTVLLQQGRSIRFADRHGNVALAAMGGCNDTLERLLSATGGMDYLEHRNGKGQTPLLLAAERGHLHALQKLLGRGASGHAVSADGRSVLAAVVCAKVPRRSMQGAGHSAMPPQAAGDCAAIVRALVEAGVDVNAPCVSPGELSPLMLAARSGNVPALVALLENGAHIDAQDRDGNVALSWAAKAGCTDAVVRLLEAPGGAELLEHRNNQGFTPLLLAAKSGHLPAMQALIDARADVWAVNASGHSALMLSARRMDVSALKALLDYGASTGLKDCDGNVALSHAAMGGCGDAVATLLEAQHGREYLNHENKRKQTPLLLAAESGRLPAMQSLLENGADVKSVDAEGRSALAMACMKLCDGSEDVNICAVFSLLGKGADIEHTTKDGATPLLLASKAGLAKTVRALHEMGPSVIELDPAAGKVGLLGSRATSELHAQSKARPVEVLCCCSVTAPLLRLTMLAVSPFLFKLHCANKILHNHIGNCTSMVGYRPSR